MAEIKGGSFLLEESAPATVFTPEDFTEEHRAIARTAAQHVMAEIISGPAQGGESGDEEMRLVRNARKITLLAMGLAYQKFLTELEKQQEVLMGIADMVTEVFAMESALLRSRKTGTGADLCAVLLRGLRRSVAERLLAAGRYAV